MAPLPGPVETHAVTIVARSRPTSAGEHGVLTTPSINPGHLIDEQCSVHFTSLVRAIQLSLRKIQGLPEVHSQYYTLGEDTDFKGARSAAEDWAASVNARGSLSDDDAQVLGELEPQSSEVWADEELMDWCDAHISSVLSPLATMFTVLSGYSPSHGGAQFLREVVHALINSITNSVILNVMMITLIERKYGDGDQSLAIAVLNYHAPRIAPTMAAPDQDESVTYVQETGNLLHYATVKSRVSILKELLTSVRKRNSAPELVDAIVRCKDNRSRNLLSIAIEELNVESVTLLVDQHPVLLQDCYANRTKAPLHQLIRNVDTCVTETKLDQQQCRSILEKLVKANAELALTKHGVVEDPHNPNSQLFCTAYDYATMTHGYFRELEEMSVQKARMIKRHFKKKKDILGAFVELLEDLIFRYLSGPMIHAAGYREYNNTELSLLDYDRMTSEAELQGFRTFITDIYPIPDAFEFPGKLSRLYLPDLTPGKLCNMTDTFKALFVTLADEDTFNIKKIYRISAKDNPKDPVAYQSIASWVAEFQVEYLDWATYDPDIQPLIDVGTNGALSLRNITLYSSGDMKCLERWIRPEGLLSINTNLEMVKIVLDLSVEENRDVTFKDLETELMRQFHEIDHAEKPELSIVSKESMYAGNPVNTKIISLNQQFLISCKKARDRFGLGKNLPPEEKHIKVAIIDTGVSIAIDRIRGSIKAGASAVLSKNKEPLPWYTYKDPHGTNLAHIAYSVNPYCFFYIYRIKDGVGDAISPSAAEAGILWALEQEVDIINLSWSFDEPHPRIRKALEKATQGPKPTLVFCAKSDEILSRDVYPADWPGTISVEMAPTEHWPTSIGVPPDLRLLGQDFPVETTTMTGSSASTAMASGIASLLLLLARMRDLEGWERLKNATAMMDIFRAFKVDNRNTPPFVDPDVLFKDLEMLIGVMENAARRIKPNEP